MAASGSSRGRPEPAGGFDVAAPRRVLRGMSPLARRFTASLSMRILLLVLLAVVPAMVFLMRASQQERLGAAYGARRRALAAATAAAREHARMVEGARALL